jgi:hypothetical protein
MSNNKRKRTAEPRDLVGDLKLFITEKFREQKQQLDTIEERVKNIEAKIESLAQVGTIRAIEQSTAKVNVFPALKRTHKLATDLDIIRGFIKDQLADLDDSEIQNIMKLLGEVALSACSAFEADHEPEAAKPWGSLKSQPKWKYARRCFES